MHSAYLSSLRWDCWMVVSLLRDVVSQPAKFFVGGEKRVFIQKGWAKAQHSACGYLKSILNLLQMTMWTKKNKCI